MTSIHDRTARLLATAAEGHRIDVAEALPELYAEMRALAQHFMREQRPNHTMQATALANEAWIRLARRDESDWESRQHFMAVAAKAMRHILINAAAAHATAKRGGGWQRVTSLDLATDGTAQPLEMLALDDALTRLDEIDQRQSTVVEMRIFGGLTTDEIAQVLDLSPRTVQLEWRMARAWLRRALEGDADDATT